MWAFYQPEVRLRMESVPGRFSLFASVILLHICGG